MRRRSFSPKFKTDAVRRVSVEKVGIRQVAAELTIHENLLRRWVREHRGDEVRRPQDRDEAVELMRLRRELRKVTAERDILKKAMAYFASEVG